MPIRAGSYILRVSLLRCFLRTFGRSSFVGVALLASVLLVSLLLIFSSTIHQPQDAVDLSTLSSDGETGLSDTNVKLKLNNYFSANKTSHHRKQRSRSKSTTNSSSLLSMTTTTQDSFFHRKVGSRLPPKISQSSTTESPECGKVKPLKKQKRFVVFSCRFEFYKRPEEDCLNENNYEGACSCAFSLPIAVAAWRRFDYEAIVFIISKPGDTWKYRKSFDYIIDTLNTIDRVHVFLVQVEQPGNDERALVRSIRLFAAKYLPLFDNSTDSDPYIVTSEVYIHPSSMVNKNVFELEESGKKDILFVLPDGCCDQFYVDNNLRRILPAGTGVGMRASKWREILEYVDEDDDIIREVRIRLHMSLRGISGYGTAEHNAVEKMFSVLYYHWLDRNPTLVCRVEDRQLAPSETRVFQLPISMQAVGTWHNIREMVRSQTGPAAVLDIEKYFNGYLQSVASEGVMDEPAQELKTRRMRPVAEEEEKSETKPQPSPSQQASSKANKTEKQVKGGKSLKTKKPPKTEVYDDRVAFMPLNLSPRTRTKPYRGLQPVQAEPVPLGVPIPFDQVLEAPTHKPLPHQQQLQNLNN